MLNVTCLKLVFRGKHVRNPVVLPTHWWYTVTEAQFSLLQSTQQVLNKSTVHDQNRWARGECLPALSGRLPEVKVHPPCRFHGARDSVRGIKDAASWRMARLLLLLGRRMGGGDSASVHMAAGTKQESWCTLSSLFLLSLQAAVRGACVISVTKMPPVVTRGVRYSTFTQS